MGGASNRKVQVFKKIKVGKYSEDDLQKLRQDKYIKYIDSNGKNKLVFFWVDLKAKLRLCPCGCNELFKDLALVAHLREKKCFDELIIGFKSETVDNYIDSSRIVARSQQESSKLCMKKLRSKATTTNTTKSSENNPTKAINKTRIRKGVSKRPYTIDKDASTRGKHCFSIIL